MSRTFLSFLVTDELIYIAANWQKKYLGYFNYFKILCL